MVDGMGIREDARVFGPHRCHERYDGDASTVCSDQPSAAEVIRRLQEFVPIDQKKANMATEILRRDL